MMLCLSLTALPDTMSMTKYKIFWLLISRRWFLITRCCKLHPHKLLTKCCGGLVVIIHSNKEFMSCRVRMAFQSPTRFTDRTKVKPEKWFEIIWDWYWIADVPEPTLHFSNCSSNCLSDGRLSLLWPLILHLYQVLQPYLCWKKCQYSLHWFWSPPFKIYFLYTNPNMIFFEIHIKKGNKRFQSVHKLTIFVQKQMCYLLQTDWCASLRSIFASAEWQFI